MKTKLLWITVVLKYLPKVVELVRFVENTLVGGRVKKSEVFKWVNHAFVLNENEQAIIMALIDLTVAVYNTTGVFESDGIEKL